MEELPKLTGRELLTLHAKIADELRVCGITRIGGGNLLALGPLRFKICDASAH
jgi:hypothetical protein